MRLNARGLNKDENSENKNICKSNSKDKNLSNNIPQNYNENFKNEDSIIKKENDINFVMRKNSKNNFVSLEVLSEYKFEKLSSIRFYLKCLRN